MPISKNRRKVTQNFFKSKQVSDTEWVCCDQIYNSLIELGRHVNGTHKIEIDQLEETERSTQQKQLELAQLKTRRCEKGSSDPIQLNCQCDLSQSRVILFYKYVSIPDPVQFALDHNHHCQAMTGKVRIGHEGINATLAGSNLDIDRYLAWLTGTAPFEDRQDLLDSDSARYAFFKPSEGCPHVFSELSIKVVDEICPLGQTSVVLDELQKENHQHGKLSPEAFHQALLTRQKDVVLLDTRNYYESRIGHFEGAIQPPIRKFSQFPEYVERNKEVMKGKTILTYCTGGIRCEKATAFMRQALPDETIYMLDGGIHNYMEWWKTKASSQEEVPVWQGKNYVFDARQSLGIEKAVVVSDCQVCSKPWDKYQKCGSKGCHLLVLCCDDCFDGQAYCCQDCKDGVPNGLCACEKERRKKELEKIQL